MERDQHLAEKNENEIGEEARTVCFLVVRVVINYVGCVTGHIGLESRTSLLED